MNIELSFLNRQNSGRIPDSHNNHLSLYSIDTFGIVAYVLSDRFRVT